MRLQNLILGVALLMAAAVGCDAQDGTKTKKKPNHKPKDGAAGPARFEKPEASNPLELVIVSERSVELTAIAAPLVARLGKDGARPHLITVGSPPGRTASRLIGRLAPKRSLVLTPAADPNLARGIEGVGAEVMTVGTAPEAAALAVARRFWESAPLVVIAPTGDPASLVHAAALAAQLGAPVLAVDDVSKTGAVAGGLKALKATEALVVGRRDQAPAWTAKLGVKATYLDHAAAAVRLVAAVGADKVRTLVLARAEGHLSWLGPYWSLARGAPVVLAADDDPDEAEKAVLGFIERHKLRPRTLAILATYNTIGQKTIQLDAPEGYQQEDWLFGIEPCSGLDGKRAQALGVGRVPASALRHASAWLLRGLVRGRLVAAAKDRKALMMANPMLHGDKGLPLCETVAKATSFELARRGIAVTEVYRKPTNTEDVLAAASKSRLIVFQGHVGDQQLFEDPSFLLPADETEDLRDRIAGDPGFPRGPPRLDGDESFGGILAGKGKKTEGAGESKVAPLGSAPLVILQSCRSLEEYMARRILSGGGVGLIGSVTYIHSASGSSFIKAVVDALTRGATVGEALRDARNYFLCLLDLKERRGHKLGVKGLRVALSFRLWGDPELTILPPEKAVGGVVSARIEGDAVKIAVPRARLPKAKTEKYVAELPPGSQVAGVVSKAKDDGPRRLLPMYFFRLDPPAGFAEKGYTTFKAGDKPSRRSVFRTDRMGRMYVLHFPSSRSKAHRIKLQLGK